MQVDDAIFDPCTGRHGVITAVGPKLIDVHWTQPAEDTTQVVREYVDQYFRVDSQNFEDCM